MLKIRVAHKYCRIFMEEKKNTEESKITFAGFFFMICFNNYAIRQLYLEHKLKLSESEL